MKPKMLVVDDNSLAGITVATLFDTLGFDVNWIANGLQVLPFLEKNPVDILILDLELPGMTGDVIYKSMKENPRFKDIPIVPFTAHLNTPAEKLTNSFILNAYNQTRVIPDIVFKTSATGEAINLNHKLIDEVAYSLLSANKEVTLEMAKWYEETGRVIPQKYPKRAA